MLTTVSIKGNSHLQESLLFTPSHNFRIDFSTAYNKNEKHCNHLFIFIQEGVKNMQGNTKNIVSDMLCLENALSHDKCTASHWRPALIEQNFYLTGKVIFLQ